MTNMPGYTWTFGPSKTGSYHQATGHSQEQHTTHTAHEHKATEVPDHGHETGHNQTAATAVPNTASWGDTMHRLHSVGIPEIGPVDPDSPHTYAGLRPTMTWKQTAPISTEDANGKGEPKD